MAALFAVGLPFTYNGTTNHFATTSGGTATVAAVTSADDVTVDGSSGNATLTVGAAWSCKTLTVNNGSAAVACDATHGITASGAVTLTAGTLNTNGQACSWGSFASSNSNARTLTLGASAITVTGTSGTPWNCATSTSLTVTANTATITFSIASTSSRTFAGGGKTYGTLTYTVANSPGQLIITGANTFDTVNVNSGRQVQFPASTTTTVTNWNVNGANNGYLYLPGASGNYASTPDAAPLRVTGDLDLRGKIALPSWTPTTKTEVLSRWAVSNLGYILAVDTTGKLLLYFSFNGTTVQSSISTAATGFAAGTTNWVRAARNATTGVVTFYTSPDGTTWTQLGTTTATTTGNIFAATPPLEVGSNSAGTGDLGPIQVYRVQVLNGIGGTVAFDADFTAKAVGANTFTESSVNGATVTINGTAAQAGDGRVTVTSSASGTAATLSKASGTVSSDYLSVKDSTATGGAAWFAGANSTNVSGNTGWTFTVPTSTGTAAQTLPSFTQAAAGTVTKPTYTATSAQTLPSFTQAASGTVTKPVYTGTAAQSLPAFTQTATGTVTQPVYTATSAQTLPAFTQQATGTATPPTYAATAAQTLPAFGQAATGTVTAPTYTATAAQTLPGLTQAATGTTFVATPTPADRTYTVSPDPRTCTVAADPRVYTVEAETRRVLIPAESRVDLIPAEARVLEVT